MNNNILRLPRMRTLDECYRELKELDSNTAVTKYFIRQLAIKGTIPSVKAGNKRLINFDRLIEYLSDPQPSTISESTSMSQNGIRKIY